MSGFIIVVLVLAVAIPFAIAHTKKRNRTWSEAARQLDLAFTPGGFLKSLTLTGQVERMQVVVDTFTRGSGKNSSTYTRFRVSFPRSLGLGLGLKQEAFFSGVSKFFGSQDIQIGDSTFDHTMMIKGNSEHSIRLFLTPARRMRIQRFMAWQHENTIDDNSIQCIKVGVASERSSIVSTVQSMVRLAWHLMEDREDDDRLQKAMRLQNEGDPEGALELIEAIVVQAAEKPVASVNEPGGFMQEPVDERRMQGELHYMAGDRELAYEAFQKLHSVDPEDEEVKEWLDMTKSADQLAADSREPVPKSSVDPAPPPVRREPGRNQGVERAPVEHERDQDTPVELAPYKAELQQKLFCDDLFGDSTQSLAVSKRFEQEYVAREVKWQGELVKVERNYSAFVFEESTGTKATFKIDERLSPYYGTDDVLAVVHLPGSAIEELKNRVGEQLHFTGKLVKVDGLMRNVYVDHGEVT
jgi:hypothetical protein